MNALEEFIASKHLDPIVTMNQLMDAGIISDNCVWPADVATVDCITAVNWLEKHQ